MIVDISYQTLQLPPPFSFAYTLHLDFRQSLLVNFQLEYLDRAALTEEEILDEGFTMQDDYTWSGKLDQRWNRHLKDLISTIRFGEPDEHDPYWIYIKTDKGEGNVADPEKWDFILQELIQAIYETSGKEKPLKINFIDREDGKMEFHELEAFFSVRECKLDGKDFPWNNMQQLVSDVYSLDLLDDVVKKPDTPGLWIDPFGITAYQKTEESKHTKKAISRIKKTLRT